jgi:hypothetical protein
VTTKPHLLRFAEGPLDGVDVPVHDFPEKVVLQMTGGRTYRYECDVTDETAGQIIHRMVLARLPDDFDLEMREEEAGR